MAHREPHVFAYNYFPSENVFDAAKTRLLSTTTQTSTLTNPLTKVSDSLQVRQRTLNRSNYTRLFHGIIMATNEWTFSAPAIIYTILGAAFTLLLGKVIGDAVAERFWSTVTSCIKSRWTRCDSLIWDDISPEDKLHTCKEPCQHITTSENSEIFSLSGFFNSTKNKSNACKKPQALKLWHVYFRTDTKTLRAFLLLFSGLGWQADVPAREMEVKPTFKKIKCDNGVDGYILTASVSFQNHLIDGRGPSGDFSVYKREMEKILEGYPPWYRTQLKLPNIGNMDHPIQSAKDIRRGGWIIAIGFNYVKPIAHHLMRFKLTEEGYRRYYDLHQAFERMVRCANQIANQMKEEVQDGTTGTEQQLYEALEKWLQDSLKYLPYRDSIWRGE